MFLHEPIKSSGCPYSPQKLEYIIYQTLVDEASLYKCGESHKYRRLTFSNAISGAYFDTFPAGAGLLLDISASLGKTPTNERPLARVQSVH